MSDACGFVTPTAPLTETPSHDLSTPRGRLLYLRDVVVERIPQSELDLSIWDCGSSACLMGWSARMGLLPRDKTRDNIFQMVHFGLTDNQWTHLAYSGSYTSRAPTHAELRAHIDDVLEGRVR